MDHFLKDVTFSDIKAVLEFQDTLKLCANIKNAKNQLILSPIGDLTIKKSLLENGSQIKIEIFSDSKIDGLVTQSQISGIIASTNFSVEQQSFSEIIDSETHPTITRSTELKADKDNQALNVLVDENNKINLKNDQINAKILADVGSFIFESLLARVGFHREIELPWFDRSNPKDLGKVRYRPLPDKTVVALDGTSKFEKCFGLEKVVERSDQSKIMWHSYYLPSGYLIERKEQEQKNQEEKPFHALVETIPVNSNSNDASSYEKKHLISKNDRKDSGLSIENDIHMESEFIKLKNLKKMSNNTYLKEHPITQALLSDLTQHLLVHKPEDPVRAMAKYFDS